MKSSLTGGVALSALLALGFGFAAHAQESAPPADAAVADAPVAQMTPEQMQQQINDMQQELDFVKQVQNEQTGNTKGNIQVWDGGLRTTSPDSDMFKVRGRLLLDAVNVNIDRRGSPNRQNYNSRNVRGRQAFLGVEGQIGSKWAYKLEGGAVNGGGWAWDDAILEYKLFPDTSIIVGNQKTVSLEDITSTRFTTFMDRGPFNSLLDLSYKLGVGIVKTGPNYSVWGAVLGNSLNSGDVTADAYLTGTNANERTQVNVRGTYTLINTDTQKLHLGGWVRYRNRGGEATGFAYNGNVNSSYNPVSLYTTGAVGNNDLTFAGEFAYVNKNLSVQGEFADVHVERLTTGRNATLGGSDFDFQTGYAFVSYFLTGEQRNYNPRGEFGRTTVLRPLDKGGIGAIEFAARIDYADLSDMSANNTATLASQYGAAAGIGTAGKYVAGTIGVNWYPISYVRFMANFTHADVDNREFGPLGAATRINRDATVNVFQLRAQLDY